MMKISWMIVFALLFFRGVTAMAQLEGYNMLYLEGEPCLILNSQVEEGSSFYYTNTRAIYKVEGGKLYLDSILSENKEAEFKFANAGEGSRIDYSGNLVVSKIVDNEKQILKLLAKGGVDIEEYTSELELISFENGVRKDECCIGDENQYCSQGFGKVMFNTWDYYSVELYQDGVKLLSLTEECDYCYGYFKVLPTGHYTVKVDYGEEGKVTFEDVEVKQGEITEVEISAYVWSSEMYREGTQLYLRGVGICDLLYSNSSLISVGDNEAPKSFYIGAKGGLELTGSKIGLSKLIGTYGFDFGYNQLNNEMDSIGGKELKRTNYSGFYYTMDLFYRQYFTLPLSQRITRPFIDLGVSYRLPLYFRKKAVFNGLRITEKWLHKYNELVLYTRVGISTGVALNVTYRPFNSIKNNLPELPKVQIGMSIMLDAY